MYSLYFVYSRTIPETTVCGKLHCYSISSVHMDMIHVDMYMYSTVIKTWRFRHELVHELDPSSGLWAQIDSAVAAERDRHNADCGDHDWDDEVRNEVLGTVLRSEPHRYLLGR